MFKLKHSDGDEAKAEAQNFISLLNMSVDEVRIELILQGKSVLTKTVNTEQDKGSPLGVLARLVPVVASHPETFSSNVLIVSLEQVRQVYGEKGDRLMSRVRDMVGRKAQELAGAHGSLIWLSPLYLLVFAGTAGQERLRSLEQQLKQILARLIGEESETPLEYFMLTGVEGTRLSFSTVVPSENKPKRKISGLGVSVPAWTGLKRGDTAGHSVAPGMMLSMDSSLRSVLLDYQWRLPEGRTISVPGTIYFPVADLRRALVGTSIAVPARAMGSKVLVGAEAVSADGDDTDNLDEIYAAQIANIDIQIGGLLAEGAAGFVSIEIPFEAVRNSPRLRRVAMAIGSMAKQRRQRLIVGLARVPGDVGESRIREVLQTLGPLCNSLIYMVDSSGRDWQKAIALGTAVLGVQLNARTGFAVAALEMAERLAAACRQAKRRSYVGLVEDAHLIPGLQAAGIDFVAGPGILPARDRPMAATAWTLHSD